MLLLACWRANESLLKTTAKGINSPVSEWFYMLFAVNTPHRRLSGRYMGFMRKERFIIVLKLVATILGVCLLVSVVASILEIQ